MPEILQDILPMMETSDMKLVTRIRDIVSYNMVDVANRLMQEYSFWYDPVTTPSKSLVFWSENHYIMNCSSELILRQMLDLPIPGALSHRIHTFLDVKKFFGTSEWLSPVYIPFTVASLINLYDFSNDVSIQQDCQILLDRIAFEVLTTSNASDASIVSPSGRAYSRHRVKTKGLHLNLFIEFLLSGQNIPNSPNDAEMALRSALSTTSYRPKPEVYTYATAKNTSVNAFVRLSSSIEDIASFMEKEDTPLDEFVSILWNYGVYMPQNVKHIQKVVQFMDMYNLWKHPHFKALNGVRKYLGCNVKCFSKFMKVVTSCNVIHDMMKGAVLADSVMFVHKEGDVVMSSLVGYNEGLPAFQQWPFAINLSGVPVWCAFGSVGTGGMACLGNKDAGKELSTARLFPFIEQSGNRLIATYSGSSLRMKCSSLGLVPKMHWPTESFDQHGQTEKWTWAIKGNAVVAYNIQKNKVEIIVRDIRVANATLTQFLDALTKC